MNKRLLLLASGSFLFLNSVLPASAASSGDAGEQLWNFLHGHGYGVLKMDEVRDNSEYFTAEVNGHLITLCLDTGASQTCFTHQCAENLGLDVHDTGKHSTGVGGTEKGTDGEAKLASFKIGGYEINRTNIVVVTPKGTPLKGSDGLFGYDFMKANAMIIPVGAHFVFYKPGPGAVMDIAPYMISLGFKPMPITHEPDGLIISGHVNEVPMTAIIDCGASFSLFSFDFLKGPANVSAKYVGTEALGVDGRRQPTYLFMPKQIDFGSLKLRPEELMAQSSPMFKTTGHQALFGYDLLAENLAIIDLGNNILWVK
jgi:predicted aspartyl protease